VGTVKQFPASEVGGLDIRRRLKENFLKKRGLRES